MGRDRCAAFSRKAISNKAITKEVYLFISKDDFFNRAPEYHLSTDSFNENRITKDKKIYRTREIR
jgi:hypothetical protein